MCTKVSFWHHGFFPKPKIAKKNIEVYKVLDLIVTPKDEKFPITYETPYMRETINFINGQATQNSVHDIYCDKDHNIIGVCACKTYARALEQKIALYRFVHSPIPNFICHCIIPKGTKYFIGKNNVIVSEKLILFLSVRNFQEYKEVVNYPSVND